MSIRQHLGTVADCNQFFQYRMVWNEAKHKFAEKEGWGPGGYRISLHDPKNWMSYEAALEMVAASNAANTVPGVVYAVGLCLTKELGVFLFDMDRFESDYTVPENLVPWFSRFAGAMTEWSSSARGAHIIGRYRGEVKHSKKPTGKGVELYTDARGVVLSPTAAGLADTDCTDALHALIAEYFSKPDAPAVTVHADGGGGGGTALPVVSGPDLTAIAAAHRQADTIKNAPEGDRNRTLNTAAHLLGGFVGAGRLEAGFAREVLVEAVKAAGWDNFDKCLRTIDGGIRSGMDEPVVRQAPAVTVVPHTPEVSRVIHDLLGDIHSAATFEQIHDDVIPRIQAAAVPRTMLERLVQALNKKLDFFDAKMPVGQLRAMLVPKAAPLDIEAGEWVHRHCFIRKNDRFYDTITGVEMTKEGFDRTYNRMMPLKPSGKRESAAEWATDRWNIVVVDDRSYRPDMPTYFEYGSREYVNSFVPASVTQPTEYTHEGVAAIEMFREHLFALCSRRPDVFKILLQWIAHNVMHPGVKIRWSPIIKGVPGDGKSILGDVLRAGLGVRNVKTTSISSLKNSGGFTDWATGAAVNYIEEIHMVGADRHALFNAIKVYISDRIVDVNQKGKAGTESIVNTTNHIANTNFTDGVPVDDSDRRWMVVFTPYTNIQQAAADKGTDVDGLVRIFKTIGKACQERPGEFRAWLGTVDLSDFDPDGRAPVTPERARMVAASKDPLDDLIMDAIENGGRHIHKDCFSSAALAAAVRIAALRESVDMPKTSAWNFSLRRLGYERLEQKIWMDGGSHRVWVKDGFKGDPAEILK